MPIASKRPAEDDLEEDEEEKEEEEGHHSTPSDNPSSTPPSGSRKRQRVSGDSLSEGGSTRRDDTPPSEYDSSDDEEEELAATQAIQQKRAHEGANEPAQCGILVNVELFNFMCHEHMVYELGPLINFICGKNGSGKSAILTAIVICLGGKASSTNRGQSLKSFIRQGQDSSRIICRIKNEGENAYLPEEYGDLIEIERFFSKHGTSGFKLKNERGRTISTKKMDLEEICDHFGLQIDNPLNVLSQDMARQFLSDSNASEKYKFFIKGVQLEQLDQDYRLIEEQLDNIEVNIERKSPDIEILEQTMLKAKARDEAMKKKDQVRERIRELRRQIAWIQVMEQENLLDEIKTSVVDADDRIVQAEREVENLDQTFQNSDTANNEAKQAFEDAQGVLQGAQDEKTERTAKRDEVKREVADAIAELRAIKTAVANADSEIKKNQESIDQEKRRLAEIQGGGAAERLRNLAEARNECAKAKDDEDSARGEVQDLRATASAAAQRLKEKANLRDVNTTAVARDEKILQELLKDRDKTEAAFGSNMPGLLRAVQQEGARFRHPPIGPLGKHIRLLKPEWSPLLEKSFGSNLSGFIVTTKHDSDILANIMRRVKCQTPILIVNTAPLENVSSHEPDAGFDTVLRILEIDNDLVRKQLILQNGIEQTILVRDLDEASKTMFDGTRLRNVKRCFCINPNNKRSGYVLSYTRSGDPSQDPIYEFTGRPRMKTDNEAQVQMRRDALQESKESLQAVERDFFEARNADVRTRQAVERANRRVHNLIVERQRWEDKIQELIDATGNDQIDEAPLRALEQGLAAAQVQKGLHAESYKDAVVSSDEKKSRLSTAQQEVAEWDSRTKDIERELHKTRQAAAKADKQRTHALQEKNAAIACIGDAKRDRDTLDRKRIEQEQKIEDYTAQASEVSQRVNVPEDKTKDKLMAEHNELRKDLDRHRAQMGGTEEEIAQAYRSALNAYKKGKRDLDHLRNVAMKLKSSLKERRDRWKIFRSLISVRAKAQFTYLLSERSFRGKLVTDHKQKLLELRVEPDITKRDGQGRNTRTLSGGEKSFSQICLLLAIWEAMGSPIRCLDEFDVFMDPVNRNLSVNLLIEAARQSVGRQFILISPGTKNDIQRAPDIRAKEIAAPERGQRTLALPIAA